MNEKLEEKDSIISELNQLIIVLKEGQQVKDNKQQGEVEPKIDDDTTNQIKRLKD